MIYIIDYTSRSLPYDEHLLKSLIKVNRDVRFICESLTGSKKLDEYSMSGLFKSREFKIVKGKGEKLIKALRYIITLIYFYPKFKQNDTVHYQWLPLIELTNFEAIYIKMLQKRGINVILTVHNVLPHETGRKYYNRFKSVYKICDHLICHTNSSKYKLVADFNICDSKISVVSHGPLYLVDSKAQIKSNNNQNSKTILLFGRVEKYKGYDVLLKAVNDYKDEFMNHGITVRIIGKANEVNKYDILNYIEEHQLDKIVKTKFSYLPDNELHEEISNSSIIVLPYKSITQSGILYLSLGYGKPIVASRLEGFIEVMANAPIYFEVNDYENLGKSLIQLCTDEVLFDIKSKEIVEIPSIMNWESIAKKTDRIYQTI